MAAVVTLIRASSGCSSFGRGRSSIVTLKGSGCVSLDLNFGQIGVRWDES